MPSARRLSPSRSLQKLRTAFTSLPTRRAGVEPQPATLSPLSTTTSASSSAASPESPTPSQQPFAGFAGFAGFSFGGSAPSPVFHTSDVFSQFVDSPLMGSQPMDSRRIIRRKKSCVELEQEQERYEFDGALVGLVEPRPRVGPALGGIEEVLCGKV